MIAMTDAEWLDHYAERKRILDEYEKLYTEANRLFNVWIGTIDVSDVQEALKTPEGVAFVGAQEVANEYYKNFVLNQTTSHPSAA